MKKNILFSMMVLAAGSVMAAPKDDVTAAAKALGDAANYTWQTTMDFGPNSQFQPGPTDGKTEKDGYTDVKSSFGDNTSEFVRKGTNAAVKTDDGWKAAAELLQGGGGGGGFDPSTFAARQAQNFQSPAAQAAELAGFAGELKVDGDKITGDLTEAGAKSLLTFRGGRRGGGGNGPSNAKGTVTFWVADGKLTKFQSHVTGTVNFGGEDRDTDRTTTTTISNVGSTKVDVSDDAKKKLE